MLRLLAIVLIVGWLGSVAATGVVVWSDQVFEVMHLLSLARVGWSVLCLVSLLPVAVVAYFAFGKEKLYYYVR